MSIQEKILLLMEQRGWSKYTLAKETGLPKTTVYNWFNDKAYTPSRNSIELICAVTDITLAEFYNDCELDKLDERQMHWLALFSKIPDKDKEKAINIIKAFIG